MNGSPGHPGANPGRLEAYRRAYRERFGRPPRRVPEYHPDDLEVDMNTRTELALTLALHQVTFHDNRQVCTCGWSADRLDAHAHVHHVADTILADFQVTPRRPEG